VDMVPEENSGRCRTSENTAAYGFLLRIRWGFVRTVRVLRGIRAEVTDRQFWRAVAVTLERSQLREAPHVASHRLG
jgi:hypothetical protein